MREEERKDDRGGEAGSQKEPILCPFPRAFPRRVEGPTEHGYIRALSSYIGHRTSRISIEEKSRLLRPTGQRGHGRGRSSEERKEGRSGSRKLKLLQSSNQRTSLFFCRRFDRRSILHNGEYSFGFLSWLSRDLGASIDYAKSHREIKLSALRGSSTFCLVKLEICASAFFANRSIVIREKSDLHRKRLNTFIDKRIRARAYSITYCIVYLYLHRIHQCASSLRTCKVHLRVFIHENSISMSDVIHIFETNEHLSVSSKKKKNKEKKTGILKF